MDPIIIHRDGQDYGPYSIAEVKQYLASGHAALTDYARFENQTDWLSLEQIINTFPTPEPISTPVITPPLETSKKGNRGEIIGFVLSLASLTGCLSFPVI